MKPTDLGLSGCRVLTTRSSLGADPFQGMLAGAGADVLCVPTLELSDPDTWEPFDQATARFSQYDWLLFTSVNGVIQTAKRLRELGLQLPQSLKIAVVGEKTAEAVVGQGWSVALVPQNYQAEGLLAALRPELNRGDQIFFPRALVAREWLVQQLTLLGAKVTLTPVYQNQPAFRNKARLSEVLASGKVDWVTFTSASTFTNFVQILGKLPAWLPKIASIGLITSQAIQQAGLQPTVTATPQTLEGLLQAMSCYETESH